MTRLGATGMRQRMKFKSIRQKIGWGIGLIIALLIINNTMNYLGFREIEKASDQLVNYEMPLVAMEGQFVSHIIVLSSNFNNYILSGDVSWKDKYMEELAYGEQLEEQLLNFNNQGNYQELFSQKEEWEAKHLYGIELYDTGKKEQAEALIDEAIAMSEELKGKAFQMIMEREKDSSNVGEWLTSTGNNSRIAMSIVASITLVISIVITIIISKSISRPIQTVRDRLKSLAEGNFNHEPLVTNQQDETNELVEATNQMTDNIKNLIENVQHVSGTLTGYSEKLTNTAQEVKTSATQIVTTMDELANGAEVQANSASDISNTMTTFANQMDHANQNGQHMEASIEKIIYMTAQGQDLMNASSNQMKHITEIVKDSVEKMKSLDQQSQEITTLVKVVNDIAEQTNLLALNAAIEAARAGEEGKGFAVVADEVRKLAEQVSSTVNSITGIASNIQADSSNVSAALQNGFRAVEEGTEQINSTRTTFIDISGEITGMISHIQEVTENLRDMANHTQEMNQSIEEVASVSEESAAGVEQTATSVQQTASTFEEVANHSEQLAELAQQLNELLHQFKLVR